MIFIAGNVPSSKNSKRIVRLKNGKTMLINSKQVMEYKELAIPQFIALKSHFDNQIYYSQTPYKIEFTFIRDSKRMFDFVNMAQVLLDLMQECEWLKDDNYLNVVPYFNPEVKIDKNNPGVIISILN